LTSESATARSRLVEALEVGELPWASDAAGDLRICNSVPPAKPPTPEGTRLGAAVYPTRGGWGTVAWTALQAPKKFYVDIGGWFDPGLWACSP
jgi:hypothetical protein